MEHGRKEIQSRKTRLHLLQKCDMKYTHNAAALYTHMYDKKKNTPKILHSETYFQT